jgi:protein-disulfide isomerase
MTKFKAALDGGTFKAAVDADMADGQKVGVQGTPNFLINGKSISGAQPFDAFAAAIREEITAMDGLMKGGKTMPQAFEERLKTNLAAKPAQAQNQRPGGPDPSDELFIPVGSSPVKGKADALITIAVISEFQCPFCKRVEPTLAALAAKYGDDVRFVFKHNPLPFHNNAEPAARAAWAAQQQGKFWENQQALTQADLEKYASELGLNMAKFKSDMESQAAKDQVKEDQALATRVAARGTPHFFINGFRLRGAQPQAKFEEIIDRELQKAKDEVGKGTPRARVYDTLQADANKGEAKMLAGGGDQPNQPAAPRAPVVIPITDEPSKGPANAKVTIVEYTDFQCPFCSRFANNLEEAIKAYPNDVRVVVKQFPLGFHQNAQIAAEASLAAHAQGKFWEMYDVMWKNQQALTRPDLEKYAEQIGLNMARFKEALDKGTYTQKVKDQMAEGQKFGVSGTPSWFVNGVFVSGALPPDAIKAKIEEALKAPAAPAAAPR